MRAILTIARYSFLQQFRNRLYLVVGLFGLILISASVLFGALAADQEVRVILDLGLAAAEVFGLTTALFGAVTLVLEEMESKTIYLILTRPLPRVTYIAGRFLGLLLAVWASVALMEVVHFAILYAKGWETDPAVLAALPLMGMKIMVMTGLALLCSLAFTSAPAAVVFAVGFWILGHFGGELSFMAKKAGPFATAAMIVFRFLLPDLEVLNLRDVVDVTVLHAAPFLRAVGYALIYTAACLAASTALFSRKEF